MNLLFKRNLRILLNLIFIFFIIQLGSLYASEQVFCNGTDDDLSSSTEYAGIMGMPQSGWSTTEADNEGVMPVGGRFKKIVVEVQTDPNPGTWIFTLRVNEVDTSLGCVITSGNTSCTLSENVTVSAGDKVAFKARGVASPTLGDVYWSMMFEPNIRKYSILMGSSAGGTMATGAFNYFPLHGHKSGETTLFDVETLIPLEGTVRSLYIDLQGTAPGAVKSYTFDVMKNGSTTGLSCSVANFDTTCSDTSNTVDVSAGDAITLRSNPSGTPTAAKVSYGVVVETDTEGEFIIALSSDDTLTNTGTVEYMFASAGDGNWGTTESAKAQVCLGFQLQSLFVELSTSPGGTSGNWVFAGRSDGSTLSGTSCSVTEPSTSCSKTGLAIDLADGAGLNTLNRETSDASNAPTANISIKGYKTPKPKLGAVLLVN